MKTISKNHIWPVVTSITLSCLMPLLGCGAKSKLDLVPVKGKVIFKNANLASGKITFNPVSVDSGRPHRGATGFIDSSGNYELSTLKKGDGVQPGKYVVCVVSYIPGTIARDSDSEPELLIPRKYVRADTTPLKAEIPADASSEMTLNFNIEEK